MKGWDVSNWFDSPGPVEWELTEFAPVIRRFELTASPMPLTLDALEVRKLRPDQRISNSICLLGFLKFTERGQELWWVFVDGRGKDQATMAAGISDKRKGL